MKTGERIKQEREKKHLSQEELGKRCGTTKQTIYKYECGLIENIPPERIKLIAAALDTTPAYIMGWNDYLSTDEVYEQRIHGVRIWANDFRFSDEQKARIIDYLSETELRQKVLIEALADAPRENRLIKKTDNIQAAIESLNTWVLNALRYINFDYSDDELDEERLKREYLSVISRLSKRDQLAWLIRMEDYIEGK